jgi:GNAT superfamily N-acetyltransferase
VKSKIHPLTPDRWTDFQRLFGGRGACAGCWCMFWLLPGKQWRAQQGERNRKAMQKLVKSNQPPGLLAYLDGQPAGWCAVGPRESYVRLAASRILKPVDTQPVWSVTCFFIARSFRRQGLTVALLEGAAKFARKCGAEVLEGYPVEPKKQQPDVFVYTGLASAYRKAGFTEVARRSPTRPIFRRVLRV